MVTVTFRVPAESGARSASVASEFNDGSRVQAIGGSSGLTPNVTRAGAGAGAEATTSLATQAQLSPHGPSIGWPLSWEAAACNWAVRAASSVIWRWASPILLVTVVEPSLHRPAPLAVPNAHQIGDLLERAAQLLGPGDERQPGHGVLLTPPP